MLLQTSVRLPSQPLEGAEPVQLRRDSAETKQDFARAFSVAKRSTASAQAAVVQFGARALDLASGGPPSSVASGVAASDDAAPSDVSASDAGEEDNSSVKGTVFAADELSQNERQQVTDLQKSDREVHTHEEAHKAAGGAHTGSIHLTYQMGPDGKRYAVEGSVPIDVSPVAGDPAATLRKMEVVNRAATAPTSPSSADRQVAAQAQRVTQQARAQMAAERYSQARDLLAPG